MRNVVNLEGDANDRKIQTINKTITSGRPRKGAVDLNMRGSTGLVKINPVDMRLRWSTFIYKRSNGSYDTVNLDRERSFGKAHRIPKYLELNAM